MATATQGRRRSLTEPTKKDSPEHWLLAGHYDPEFVSAVVADLNGLAQLQPGWDGYGAPPVNQDIITGARRFIESLPENLVYRPRVVPMSTGNIQFEWHHGSKVLELEFEAPHTIHFLQWHPEAGVEEEATFGTADVERAVELIQWFMSGTCV